MTTDTWVQLGVTVGLSVAGLAFGWNRLIAKVEARLEGHDERIVKLELTKDAMPKDYVPRLELDSRLASIEKQVAESNGLLKIAIYGGKRIGDYPAAYTGV